jgi:hypothetical protein
LPLHQLAETWNGSRYCSSRESRIKSRIYQNPMSYNAAIWQLCENLINWKLQNYEYLSSLGNFKGKLSPWVVAIDCLFYANAENKWHALLGRADLLCNIGVPLFFLTNTYFVGNEFNYFHIHLKWYLGGESVVEMPNFAARRTHDWLWELSI